MNVCMTEQDYEQLTTNSMKWGNSWASHDGRFENYTPVATVNEAPSYSWGYAYWLGDNVAGRILATSYLTSEGHDWALLWDLASEEWLILTDYAAPVWRRAIGEQ